MADVLLSGISFEEKIVSALNNHTALTGISFEEQSISNLNTPILFSAIVFEDKQPNERSKLFDFF